MFHNKCEAREELLTKLALDEIRELAKQVARLTESLNAVGRRVGDVEGLVGGVIERLNEAPTTVSYASGVPLYMSEDEEDLKYQVEQGIVDKDLAADILRHAGFDNTEVDFES